LERKSGQIVIQLRIGKVSIANRAVEGFGIHIWKGEGRVGMGKA
jgi:hypothetical protein